MFVVFSTSDALAGAEDDVNAEPELKFSLVSVGATEAFSNRRNE